MNIVIFFNKDNSESDLICSKFVESVKEKENLNILLVSNARQTASEEYKSFLESLKMKVDVEVFQIEYGNTKDPNYAERFFNVTTFNYALCLTYFSNNDITIFLHHNDIVMSHKWYNEVKSQILSREALVGTFSNSFAMKREACDFLKSSPQIINSNFINFHRHNLRLNLIELDDIDVKTLKEVKCDEYKEITKVDLSEPAKKKVAKKRGRKPSKKKE